MNTLIREMTTEDIEQVRQVYILGWQNAFRGIVPQPYLDTMNLDDWAPPLNGAYVLTDEKNILGTSSIAPARDSSFAFVPSSTQNEASSFLAAAYS